MAKIFQIFVGSPEDDKKVSVDSGKTIAQVLSDNNVSLTGMVQLNGKTLAAKDHNKTLQTLNVRANDSLHIVRKMDGARG